MYFCTVNGNSKVMICTLSSPHWQHAGFKNFQPCGALSWFQNIEINAPIINTIQCQNKIQYNIVRNKSLTGLSFPSSVCHARCKRACWTLRAANRVIFLVLTSFPLAMLTSDDAVSCVSLPTRGRRLGLSDWKHQPVQFWISFVANWLTLLVEEREMKARVRVGMR